jgi:signal transduction histidine kinase
VPEGIHADAHPVRSQYVFSSSFLRFLPLHLCPAFIESWPAAVPILNVDKRPFALLCAYNASDATKRYLEGHELSYLRAIGVIILSAVLKRRMILADKAKSLFISNISHELRTPLHGILAAAELLADTGLAPTQVSFLQTVQACGTSLVETVNHVLDFTKLSGNTRSGGVDTTIRRSRVDMMQLIEEAVEGSWIGHQARMSAMESEIGSVYAPPKAVVGGADKHVEAVIDIGRRAGGWLLKCEKGGIRRVLMNIFGNSLKFTTVGSVYKVG